MSKQHKQGLGSTFMIPSLLSVLALLLSFKPAHRTSLSDISLPKFDYG